MKIIKGGIDYTLLKSTIKTTKKLIDNETILSGSSKDIIIDVKDKSNGLLTTKINYNNSTPVGSTIRIFTSPDGENFDNIPYLSKNLSNSSENIQESFKVSLDSNYIKISIINNETSNINISMWVTMW